MTQIFSITNPKSPISNGSEATGGSHGSWVNSQGVKLSVQLAVFSFQSWTDGALG